MRNFPWGRETHFRQKILDGVKVHTFRETPRIKKGHKLQMVDGSQWHKDKEQFNEAECIDTQEFEFEISEYGSVTIKCGDRIIPSVEHWQLAVNDGFETTFQFYRWLFIKNKPYFKLWLSHWTDLRY